MTFLTPATLRRQVGRNGRVCGRRATRANEYHGRLEVANVGARVRLPGLVCGSRRAGWPTWPVAALFPHIASLTGAAFRRPRRGNCRAVRAQLAPRCARTRRDGSSCRGRGTGATSGPCCRPKHRFSKMLLAGRKFGGKEWRILASDLRAFMAGMRTAAASEGPTPDPGRKSGTDGD